MTPTRASRRAALDVLRALYVVAAVVYTIIEPEPLYVLVTAAAVVLIRWADLPELFDLTFIVGMTLAGWGEVLGVYERFTLYDEIVHVLMPLLITPVVYILVSRLGVLRPLTSSGTPPRAVGVVVVGLCLGLSVATIWELIEWTADGVLGWTLAPGLQDTMLDLALGAVGSLAGAALLVIWSGRGWGTGGPPEVSRPRRARSGA